MKRPRTPRATFRPSGSWNPIVLQPNGRGPGLASIGLGRTGRKRLPRSARMALRGRSS